MRQFKALLSNAATDIANQRPDLNVCSRYDDFLFAAICDAPGETRLSVVSALARLDVDPWAEAARLAALSTEDAQSALVPTLNLYPGNRRSSSETEMLAARLAALLPKAPVATTASAPSVTQSRAQRSDYWLVWLCFAIAMTFLSPHQHASTATSDDAAPASNAAPRAEDSGAKPAHSEADSRPEAAMTTSPTVPIAGLSR